MKTSKAQTKARTIVIHFTCMCAYVLLLSSCAIVKVDGVKELNTKTEFQKLPDDVKQLWQLPIQDEEIDQIVPYNDSNVLLKTIKIDRKLLAYFYYYSNLSLVDLNKGKVYWTYSTLNLEQKSQNIIAVSPLILINTRSDANASFYAVSPDSGKLVWKYIINGLTSYFVSTDNNNLYLSFKENGNWVIEKHSIINGNVIWKSTLDINNNITFPPKFIPAEDITLIVGCNIISLYENDGKNKWKNNLKNDIGSYLSSQGQIWLYNYHQIVLVDPVTGKFNNEFIIPDTYINCATVYDNDLFASTFDSVSNIHRISCYDLGTHNLNWELPIESNLKSSMYKDGDDLYFTTNEKFFKIGIKDGSVNTSVLLPETTQKRTVVSDIIQKNNDKFIVARENSILVISEKERSVISKTLFGISGGYTPSYLQNKLNEIKLAMIPDSKRPSSSTINLFEDKTFYNLARQNQAWVYTNTASTLNPSSNASHSDKMSAYNQRANAVQASYSQGRLQAQQDLMRASMQFGSAVGNALVALMGIQVGKAISQDLDYLEEKINASVRYQTNCFNGNLCLKPYYENGWRLALLDLNNIGYATIPMVPGLFPLHYSVTNSLVYTVVNSADKKYLLVKALKPEAQNHFYNYRYSNLTYTNLLEWTLPAPSVICYDITNVGTNNGDISQNQIPLCAKSVDKELIEAAFSGDEKKVEKLIEAKADVNAVDEYGHTPIMHACQIGNYKIIKSLLKAGANPKIADPEGFDAYDYLFLPTLKGNKDYAPNFNKIAKKIYDYSKNFK